MKKAIAKMVAVGLFFMSAMVYGQDLDMVKIPGADFEMLRTEVTQELYESVMGVNPSCFKEESEAYEYKFEEKYVITQGENPKKLPVECVSWYDAIYFCNKLSNLKGKMPVYTVDGESDVTKWNYTPNAKSFSEKNILKGDVSCNLNADGFRLPTKAEWFYAAKGGEYFYYAGSDDFDEVGWNINDSNTTHEVAKKEPNGYGLYDMSGNVYEWCWDKVYEWCWGKVLNRDTRYVRSGCKISSKYVYFPDKGDRYVGFRIVCGPGLTKGLLVKTDESVNGISMNSIYKLDMVKIPHSDFEMLRTEVTQELYESVTGVNPSYFQEGSEVYEEEEKEKYVITRGENPKKLPVERISLMDVIYFCNKLSTLKGKKPVYALDGESDVTKWKLDGYEWRGEITCNLDADGFRLPTKNEWKLALYGYENCFYDDIVHGECDEVAWLFSKTHEVAKKSVSNAYGLYDLVGNVAELCWDFKAGKFYDQKAGKLYYLGGSIDEGYGGDYEEVLDYGTRSRDIGFRIVCSSSN